MRSLDNGVGKVELPVKLERPRLNGERSRRRAWRLGLVEDPHLGAELRQPEREHQPGRSGADDQNVAPRQVSLLSPSAIGTPVGGASRGRLEGTSGPGCGRTTSGSGSGNPTGTSSSGASVGVGGRTTSGSGIGRGIGSFGCGVGILSSTSQGEMSPGAVCSGVVNAGETEQEKKRRA